MNHCLYELCWQVETDVHSFFYREFKVFRSVVEARKYGEKRENELNDGIPIEKRSHDGFYYRYLDIHEVNDIDRFQIELKEQ